MKLILFFILFFAVSDDTSEYIIKVEVANETIMNISDVTQEYVNEDTMWAAIGDHRVDQDHDETTNLHLQNISLCEEGTTREADMVNTITSKETPYQEVDTSLINPFLMATGMRVSEVTSLRDEFYTDDLCEINVPECSFSEIVDEVLIEEEDYNNGLLETIENFTNKCRSEGASRRLTYTVVDDSVAGNQKVPVQCQLKGVPKIKDLKKVKKNKRNGRRWKGA